MFQAKKWYDYSDIDLVKDLVKDFVWELNWCEDCHSEINFFVTKFFSNGIKINIDFGEDWSYGNVLSKNGDYSKATLKKLWNQAKKEILLEYKENYKCEC